MRRRRSKLRFFATATLVWLVLGCNAIIGTEDIEYPEDDAEVEQPDAKAEAGKGSDGRDGGTSRGDSGRDGSAGRFDGSADAFFDPDGFDDSDASFVQDGSSD